MMQLAHNNASPFVRKVMVVLHETGQVGDVALRPSTGTPLAAGSLPVDTNPLGKVPVLERDGAPAIYDSRVICRFLDDRAKAGLYPAGRLWEVLTLEATADGMIEAAVLMVYEGRCRPEDKRSDEWVEAQWSKVARALDVLEGRWMSHLSGPLDMGQIAVACALGYLDFRHADRGWREGHPGLTEFAERWEARPSMAATAPSL